MPVIVMICFARSGGTLLNRCLGSLPNVVILSELNPLGGGWGKEGPSSLVTVKEQARKCFHFNLSSDDFAEGIKELEKYCVSAGKQLVLRDWSYVNFSPCEYNKWDQPNRFLPLESLENNCQLIPFALVRDSIDVWISRGTPPVDEFFNSLKLHKSDQRQRNPNL